MSDEITKGSFDTPLFEDKDVNVDDMQWEDPFPEYAESPYSQAQNASPGWTSALASQDSRYERAGQDGGSPLTWVPDVYNRQRTPVPGYGMGLQGNEEKTSFFTKKTSFFTKKNVLTATAAGVGLSLLWSWWKNREV